MATAIISLVTGRAVSEEVAMTGEITITGQVLPIGGIREKLLAAQQAEIKRVILPRENAPDLEDLPEETRQALTLVPVDSIGEVIEAALGTGDGRPARAVPRSGRRATSAKPRKTSPRKTGLQRSAD
jgi:ATP-dependent Lon protease